VALTYVGVSSALHTQVFVREGLVSLQNQHVLRSWVGMRTACIFPGLVLIGFIEEELDLGVWLFKSFCMFAFMYVGNLLRLRRICVLFYSAASWILSSLATQTYRRVLKPSQPLFVGVELESVRSQTSCKCFNLNKSQ
jgi:hypothetical protein